MSKKLIFALVCLATVVPVVGMEKSSPKEKVIDGSKKIMIDNHVQILKLTLKDKAFAVTFDSYKNLSQGLSKKGLEYFEDEMIKLLEPEIEPLIKRKDDRKLGQLGVFFASTDRVLREKNSDLSHKIVDAIN